MERKYIKKPRWKVFTSNCMFYWFPKLYTDKLRWKDKYGPRVETTPYINIQWLSYEIHIYRGNPEYWERYLWIHKYNNGDEEKAKETWPWKTKDKNIKGLMISTW